MGFMPALIGLLETAFLMLRASLDMLKSEREKQAPTNRGKPRHLKKNGH